MFEDHHDDHETAWNRQRRGYILCWAGFGLLACNLLVSIVLNAIYLAPYFIGRRIDLGTELGIANLHFYTDTFRCWTRVIVGGLLVGAWAESGWRRKSGVYLVIAMVESIIWAIQYAPMLGLAERPFGHEVLRGLVLVFFSLTRLFLMGSLAGEFCGHLGVKRGADLAKTARGTSVLAAFFWALNILQAVDWGRWPLAWRPFMFHMGQFERFYSTFLMITIVQLFLVTLMSSRSALHALKDMKREESDFDPWAASSSDRELGGSPSAQHRSK